MKFTMFSGLLDRHFMPHGHCYFWEPDVLWSNVGADIVIAAAYFTIPALLVYLAKKRKNLPFHWMFFLFGLFIFTCGLSHVMEAVTVWWPYYRLEGLVKVVTACASVGAAVLLFPLVPKALLLRTPADLEIVNLQMRTHIAEKEAAEARLRENAEALERGARELAGERESFAHLVEQNPAGILVARDDGRVRFANRAARAFLGWPEGDGGERHFPHPLRGPDYELEAGPEGARASLEVTVSPTRWEGEPACLVLLRDITEQKRAREEARRLNLELRQRVDELQVMFDVLPVGVAIAEDTVPERIRPNPVLARMLDLPPGGNASKAAPDPERPPYRVFRQGRELAREELPMEMAMANGVPVHGVELEVEAGGRRTMVLGSAAPLFEAGGRVRGSVAAFVDITAMKRAEARVLELNAELRQRVDELQVIFELLPMGVAIADDPACRNIHVNPALARVLGIDARANASKGAPERERPAYRVFARGRELPPEELPMQVVGATGAPVREVELEIEAGGRTATILASASPLFGPAGAVRGCVGAFVDITEVKRAEAQVRELNAELRQRVDELQVILELLPVGVGIAEDPECRTIRANPALAQLLGIAPGGNASVAPDGPPPPFRVLLGGREPAVDDLPMQSAASTGATVRDVELEFLGPRPVAVLANAAPLFDASGRIRGCVGAFVDITEMKRTQEALREGEERFRLITEAIPQVVFTAGPDGRLDYFNRRWYEYTGQDEATALEAWPEAIHPDDLPGVESSWKAALETGNPHRVEMRFRRADGAYRWFLGQALPLRDAAGAVVKWFGSLTDVHDRKAAAEEVARSRDQLDAILKGIQDGVVVQGVDGALVFANEAAARFAGFASAAELLALRREDASRRVRPLDADGAPLAPQDYPYRRVLRGEEVRRMAIRAPDPEGERWLEVDATRIPAAGDRGDLILTTSHDVTEIRRAQAALAESEERFRATFNQAAVGIGHLATDGRWLRVNRKLADILGYRPEEMVGLRFQDVTHPEDVAGDEADLARLLAGEIEAYALEKRYLHRDGHPVWVAVTRSLVRGADGSPKWLISMVEDIRARKRTEEALRRSEEQFRQAQKMESIGRLAGGVAHDFNNLLTAINGYSGLLLSEAPPGSPLREGLVEIHKAGQRAAGLTSQLLAFSRKQILAPRVVDLNLVVEDMEKMLRRLIGEDVELQVSLPAGPNPIRVDPGQLEQIILNLAVNARDAMPGGGRLRIESRRLALRAPAPGFQGEIPPGEYAVLAFADTGQGMDEATRSRLFEPFFTTKEIGKGTGLGLSTVYGIVQQSGGHITVDSAPGRGAIFTLYFPPAPAGAGGAEATAAEPMPRGSETVLLVEDEEPVRRLVDAVLRMNGYTVLQARDGGEALRVQAAHPGPIHLLLTDLVMAGMGGRELAERMRALRPGIRILYMSGYTDDTVVRAGGLEGEARFLQKPFSPSRLASMLREVLADPA